MVSETLRAFIGKGVSIMVASCEGSDRPALGRALGCQVSKDSRSVTIFLASSVCSSLIRAIDSSRRIAVVFAEPSTHRSTQLKGPVVSILRAHDESGAMLSHYAEAFSGDLARCGYSDAFTRALLSHDPAEILAVTFLPSAAFDQTPGPQAGGSLQP
jgi:hypothetical protein